MNIKNGQANGVVTKAAGTLNDFNILDFVKQVTIFGKPNRSNKPNASLNTLTETETIPAGTPLYIFGGDEDIDRPDQFFPPIGLTQADNAYRTAVLSDNPLYYASLSQAAPPMTPLVGTGNMSLVNGALPNQTGLLTGEHSVQTDGTNDYIATPVIPFNASGFKWALITFLAYIDLDATSGTLAFALMPPDTDNFDTQGVAGNFIATFSGGGNKGYLAVKGNQDSVGSYSQRQFPQPSFGARHHFAFYISNAGFTNMYLDGEGIDISVNQLSPGANNTNNFVDGMIKFMGFGTSGSTKGRLEEVSIWGASAFAGLPTSARVQAHAALVS